MLDGGGAADVQPIWRPDNANLYDVKSGPLALAGPDLIGIYREYTQLRQSGNNGPFNSSRADDIRIRGDYVAVDIHGWGSLGEFTTVLQNLGMKVEHVSTQYNVVEGLFPIAQLPTLANLPQIVDVAPVYLPTLATQGVSANQGDRVLGSDTARQQFNVNGRGITVGVLSDSVNRFQGGLADSVGTGDLPNNVTVLQDLPVEEGAGSDEGRAMLEQIYDIAPGAGLAFATAFTGPLGFAAGIQALAGFGAQVIVDDVGYANEPMFQDGIIAQAVTNVTRNNNVTYLSSAGNSADKGYESVWRGVDTTVAGIAGRFMNFNPGSGAAVTQLPITVNSAGLVIFQWDNPFGKTNGVTTDMDIYIIDGNGAIVAQGNANNIATNQPIELFDSPGAGNYTVAVRATAGTPNVGRIRFQGFGAADITISQQFGSAGGTTYPTTFGHSVSNEAIGVGAVPWFGAPPFSTTTPIQNEDFSSFGPVNIVFDAAGNRLPSVERRLKPDFSGPDANNTSFFGQLGGVPAGLPDNDYTLPNFFGTSSAAPNLAAVVALAKQLSPAATLADIKSAFLAAATPLNGSAQGTWDPQGGYGLPNASQVLTAIDRLRVVSITPGASTTITSLPSFITVTFSKPINFSTVQASDLVVTGPDGVQVVVGTPISVGGSATPTSVQFPIVLNRSNSANANGNYTVTLADGAVTSQDGKPLIGAVDRFTLNDTIAPRVVETQLTGRTVSFRFSEAVDPTQLVGQNLLVIRAGMGPSNPTGAFGNPANVILSLDSRVVIRYDSTTFTVSIDFTQLPQAFLPTDIYALVALAPQFDSNNVLTRAGITDLVGNSIDGEFTGSFPSGNGVAGGDFVQALGLISLTAPIFNSVQLDPGGPNSPSSDSGIPNDQNTNVKRPTIVGQIGSSFPGTAAGVTILAQFNGYSDLGSNPNANFSLATGFGGRGFVGDFNVITTTDANGNFSLTAPADLPDGFNRVRLVVIGEPDQPPLPGLSNQIDYSFRVDTTRPTMDTSGSHPSGASIPQNSSLGSLQPITLFITDPVLPSSLTSPFAVPSQLSFFALDPATATNISNYALINYGADRVPGGTGADADIDYSNFIRSATFQSTTNRGASNEPYTATVTLSFLAGLPRGRYALIARSASGNNAGVTDSAGNSLAGNPGQPDAAQDYTLNFDFQPEPVYITGVNAKVSDNDAANYDIRSFFEVPTPGVTSRAPAPPTVFFVDFSSTLPGDIDYTDMVQLLASANTVGGFADGEFGDLGVANTLSGYSRVAGTSVTLGSSNPGAQPGEPGYNNRLILRLADNTTLLPDNYRLFVPNTGSGVIRDVFNNQLDGEFRANKTADGLSYENLLPNGQYRQGLSGDGVQGGSFVTGYTVVSTGNIIYARPDYIDDPFNIADDPDGSLAKPFSALAPEAIPTGLNGGDLNAQINFGTNFNTAFDRNGDGRFTRSALFAAQQRSVFGPVVVVLLPGTTVRNPVTQQTSQQTFVLQAPAGNDAVVNDGSTSVPQMTTLVFDAGSSLKMLNASLFVQNQGSAIQMRGGAGAANQVNITSYNDDTVGGDTNRNSGDSVARGGDYGGIVFRNYDMTNRSQTFPGQIPTTGNRTVDGRLKSRGNQQTPGGLDAVAGSDDIMSYLDSARVRFGGGTVPQTTGTSYDAITLINARTSVTNTSVSESGGLAGAQAGLSGNVDSFREDQLLRGPIIRRTTLTNNSINGIYVRGELNGVAQPTDAIHYALNPVTAGGVRNYVFESPLPYVFTTRMVMGSVFRQETAGQVSAEADRLYIAPGMLLKFQRGSALETQRIGGARQSSIIIGDRTYISQWDLNQSLDPSSPNFRPPTTGDATVLFTSFFDDLATTSFFDPVTQITTPIVAPLDSDNGGSALQPTGSLVDPLARWGNIAIQAGTVTVIDEAEIRYGGGTVNTSAGTAGTPSPLTFRGADGTSFGTRAYITNNFIHDNLGASMTVEPDGLLAGNAQRPLQSGHPFFRGNILTNSERNGLEVLSSILPPGTIGDSGQFATQFASTVWDSTDLTYLLRSTIVLAGDNFTPLGSTDTLDNIPTPSVTLTLQSALPDTVLASGERIARPGESLLVKLLSALQPLGDGVNGQPSIISGNNQFGAGFAVGFDNGVDPTPDSLVDEGVNSQIRITGIGANETTGQLRVPVIITSMRDDSVGKTVRNVNMNVALAGNTTAPAAGDGGVIMFGGQQLTDYNLYDPRDGSIIDNADIKYMTRVEQVGRTLYRTWDTNGDAGFDPILDNFQNQKAGLNLGGQIGFANQFNQPNAMTVSNSNFANFSQTGFLAHPGFNVIALAMNYPQGPPNPARLGIKGGPTNTFLINNTFSNMPTAVRINSENVNNDQTPTPPQAVILNNTFYNNGFGIDTNSAVFNGLNSLSHVAWLGMNNIFANQTTLAVRTTGQVYGSQLQYNLFDNNAANVQINSDVTGSWQGNNQPVNGSAGFRNAGAGNFNLLPTSDAIDASRSEIGPLLVGNMLNPAVNQLLNGNVGVRNQTGRINWRGGLGFGSTNLDIVTLPGFPIRTFLDQWVPVLQGTPNSFTGTATTAGLTYAYTPIQGERDALGFFRQDFPGKANVGFGSRPFFDIGAFEYRELFPPHIITVTANVSDSSGTSTINIYNVGGIAGTNKSPQVIQIGFDSRLDPSTVNNQTVFLDASGGDGLFGNGNSAQDRTIDLSGKLSFDQVTKLLTINLATSGLVLSNDAYRIRVLGNGSNVIRDQTGNALDGENLDVNGAQRALPSGDGFPGGNFVVTFTIDTSAPSVVNGSFRLDPSTDTNRPDVVTANRLPAFSGTISDAFPPLNPLVGQTVLLDISTKGDGNFDLIGVGTATTDASGNFLVVSTVPIPDTPFNVGPDGILGTPDDSGYALARIRVVDQSGNVSLPIDATVGQFAAAGALTNFIVDTVGPRITSFSPASGSVATVSAAGVSVTVGFNENIDPASLNGSSIRVVRAGGDGDFTNGTVAMTIDASSIVLNYLPGGGGAMTATFNVTGAFANDIYRVTISGSSTPVIDIAGNALDGEFSGSFPSGDGTVGGDFNSDFVIFDSSLITRIYVGAGVSDPTATQGSRANPFPTITEGLAAALTGDVVAVLPGVYTESITLKSLVSLVSADITSDDSNFVAGDPLKTIIRAPEGDIGTQVITVNGSNVLSVTSGTGLNTELSGFTIASSLLFDPATGSTNPDSIGLALGNSNVLVTRNYFVNSGVGVSVSTTGALAATPRFINNVIAGNTIGMRIDDSGGTTTSLASLIEITNNTFAFNDLGLRILVTSSAPQMAVAFNNIYWQNHDLTAARLGAAIEASAQDKILVQFSLFSGNGPSQTSNADDMINVGGGTQLTPLSTTPDFLGNRVGDPMFVSPRDPRSAADGPGVFFNDANFDLTLSSAAVDQGWDAAAPPQDFLYRARTLVRGPRVSDIGAFEFRGTGGRAAGGQLFRVVTTSLAPDGSSRASFGKVNAGNAPQFVDVTFSDDLDKSSVDISDLVLSGNGVNAGNPLRASSLSWIDDHTVRFNLTGGYNNSGTVQVVIPTGAVRDRSGRVNDGLIDGIAIVPSTVIQPPVVQPPVTPPPVTNPLPQTPAQRQAAKRAAAKQAAAQRAAAQKAARQAAAAQRAAARQLAAQQAAARRAARLAAQQQQQAGRR